VNSVQRYWADQLRNYREAPTRFFTGQTVTGCGGATSAVGPFYCPRDQTVYAVDVTRTVPTIKSTTPATRVGVIAVCERPNTPSLSRIMDTVS
jgi:hypothetical protein